MAKYEAMAVVSGKLDEAAAKKVIEGLQQTLGGVQDLQTVEHGLKPLAYEIKGNDKGYYVQFNFDATGEQVAEFRRLAIINADVLRQLVVNLEKAYGYRSSVNPGKVQKLEKKRAGKAEWERKREEEIKNNPELAARIAAAEARRNRYRSGGYRRPNQPYGTAPSSGGGFNQNPGQQGPRPVASNPPRTTNDRGNNE